MPAPAVHPLASAGAPSRFGAWGLRFVAVYFVCFNFEALAGLLPSREAWIDRLGGAIDGGIAWIGHHLLGVTNELSTAITGSSDKPVAWLRLVLSLAFAAGVATGWMALDRDRAAARSPLVRRWLRLGTRYVLGSDLFLYGVMKLIPPTQFPAPSLHQLMTTLGDTSPMGLLWRFMGFSPVYTAVTGGAEALAGVLLLFRRTTLAGALFAAGIMTNVVLLNFCYDVPVKLYSCHLLLMALWLLGPDLPQLTAFLWHHRPALAAPEPPAIARPPFRRIAIALKLLVVAWALGSPVYRQLRQGGTDAARFGVTPPELKGIWQVETFVRDGAPVPPLTSDPTRWSVLIIGDYRIIQARGMNGRRIAVFLVDRAATPGAYTLTTPGVDSPPRPARITFPESGVMQLATTDAATTLAVTLRRLDESTFLLNHRGFHWISERAYNR